MSAPVYDPDVFDAERDVWVECEDCSDYGPAGIMRTLDDGAWLCAPCHAAYVYQVGHRPIGFGWPA